MANGFKSTGVALVELCSLSGAVDGFVQQGSELVENNLQVSDQEAERLAKNIGTLAGEYRKSARTAPEILLGFKGGTLLIVWGDIGGVTLRFRDEIDRLETIIAECRTFLKQSLGDTPPPMAVMPIGDEPAVDSEQAVEIWAVYEPKLIGLLAKIISRGQASLMVQRVIDSLEISSPIDVHAAEEITRRVLEKVPDRRKRDALTAEAKDLLKLLTNS